jgi:hypothetical protein
MWMQKQQLQEGGCDRSSSSETSTNRWRRSEAKHPPLRLSFLSTWRRFEMGVHEQERKPEPIFQMHNQTHAQAQAQVQPQPPNLILQHALDLPNLPDLHRLGRFQLDRFWMDQFWMHPLGCLVSQ